MTLAVLGTMMQNAGAVSRQQVLLILLTALGLCAGCIGLPFTYVTVSNFVVGLVLLPFVIIRQGPARINVCYLLGVLFFGWLAHLYLLKIFFFLMVAFFLLLVWEAVGGKLNTIILFQIALMSPVFLQVTAILGFPIRLWLSQCAGMLLQVGWDVQVEGNLMILDGFQFAVDEACMGLSMLSLSMLMGVFAIVHHYRKAKRTLSLGWLVVFFAAVFGLNVLSNLFRIVMLVLFRILPEDPLHEIIGVLCLLLYVMVPLYFLAKTLVRKFGKPFEQIATPTYTPIRSRLLLAALGIFVLSMSFTIRPEGAELSIPHAFVEFKDAKGIELNGGITKLTTDDLLIYVKTIPEFFTGEHTPLLCWRGSGYQFKSIRKEHMGQHEIYKGVLSRDQEKLYTAWWYTNGNRVTIDQWEWRSRMVTEKERFALVNVTAKDEMLLDRNLKQLFKGELIVRPEQRVRQ
ncbi:exosortase N [Chryseolinea soli]|uniref:Exosortase N n=1 Tax=Chryseolinea soli TaxID=2321403 RepID=A0A385SZ40_9BACT|nr:exosortase N [Chryseolinea soli]AYB35060.1 exosortase N [Chryseolinea soli]